MTKNIVVTYDDWHSCGGHEDGGFWTTRLFWDCECEKNYVRPKSLLGCAICGVFEFDGQPDSRVTEVLEAGVAVDVVISVGYALEIVYELAEQNALEFDHAQCEGGPLPEQAFIQRRSLDVVHDLITKVEGLSAKGEALDILLENVSTISIQGKMRMIAIGLGAWKRALDLIKE